MDCVIAVGCKKMGGGAENINVTGQSGGVQEGDFRPPRQRRIFNVLRDFKNR